MPIGLRNYNLVEPQLRRYRVLASDLPHRASIVANKIPVRRLGSVVPDCPEEKELTLIFGTTEKMDNVAVVAARTSLILDGHGIFTFSQESFKEASRGLRAAPQ